MEHQKDNRRDGRGDRVPNQGQYRPNDTQTVRSDSSGTARPEGQSIKPKTSQTSGVSFIVRKAEKLTTALYMVTDIMSDKEPMKWKIRETGVELLSDITVSVSAGASERMSSLRNVMKKIERVVSFLEIAETTRMISEMNSSVLKREYLSLKDIIEGEWKRVYDNSKSIFNDSFFDVGSAPERTLENKKDTVEVSNTSHDQKGQNTQNDVSANVPQGHASALAPIKDNVIVNPVQQNSGQQNIQRDTTPRVEPQVLTTPQPIERNREVQSGSSVRPEAIQSMPRSGMETPQIRPAVDVPKHTSETSYQGEERRVSDKPFSQTFATRVSDLPSTPRPFAQPTPAPSRSHISDMGVIERSRPDVGRDDRRKIILALIKQKPSLTVKDISKSIPGVSEKTIQRELLSMVGEGILQKRGERRWSTYSLREG